MVRNRTIRKLAINSALGVALSSVWLVLIALALVALQPGSTRAQSTFVDTFDFHIGDVFLASLNPAFSGGASARDAAGDIITLVGQGHFEVKDATAGGGGIFVHRQPDTTTSTGKLLGTGTWKAERLLHFDDFGGQLGLPPTFHGGHAVIGVHVVGHPGGDPTVTAEFDAVLTIDVKIGAFPAGFQEGINFDGGSLAFDEKAGGVTVFVAK